MKNFETAQIHIFPASALNDDGVWIASAGLGKEQRYAQGSTPAQAAYRLIAGFPEWFGEIDGDPG